MKYKRVHKEVNEENSFKWIEKLFVYVHVR